MTAESTRGRLCSIATLWGLVFEAHRSDEDVALAARRELLGRYGGAARRYLMASVGDPDSAEELFQEFALCFLGGDFHKADPGKGRFRDYVKTSLYHLILKHRRKRRHRRLADDLADPAVEPAPLLERDPAFLASWRDDLLARCWEALADAEARGGAPLYSVLRFQADNPTLRSPEIAEQVGARVGRPLNPAGVRQLLHRAREKFADLLVEEVAHSLGEPSDERLAEELAELGLIEYCRPALERRG